LEVCKISHFSEVSSISPIFLSSPADLFNWKKDLNLTYRHGPLSPRLAQLDASLGPIQRAKPAVSSVFLETLSSGRQCLMGPTR
jgi:hypothetical protein